MRKKIIGVSVVFVVLAMLCVQPVCAAREVTVGAWTDKPWYNPGEKGKLKISVLNGLDKPVEIRNITITYPWKVYDADKDEWVGNKTIRGTPIKNMDANGSANDHYYTEVDFEVPSDGRACTGRIYISVGTTNGTKPSPSGSLAIWVYVAGTGGSILPTLIVGLDTWMTSLGVLIVICTIILAAVIFLSTRGTRVPRMVTPSPPPKAKS